MIVCHCAAVSDRRIRELVAGGARDVLGVAAASGAGSFCGGCLPVIVDLLTDALGRPVPESMGTLLVPPGGEPPAGFKRAQEVVHELQEDLAAGEWERGQPLEAEAGLAARYGVSRGVLREALRLLVHHGALHYERGRFVASAPVPSTISAAAAIQLHCAGATIEHVVDARRALEPSLGNPVLELFVEALLRLTLDLALPRDGPGPEDMGLRARADERPAAALARVIVLDIRRRGAEPGDVLGSEFDLARRYDTSTTRLREAVSLLELYAAGYRRPGPGAGVVVARPDHWPVAQLMAHYLNLAGVSPSQIAEARFELELRSVELASARIDEAGAERLRRRLAEELTALSRESNGYHGYHNIHPMIGELSGNPVITLFTSALVLALIRGVEGRPAPPRRAAARKEIASTHAAIVAAVIDGNGQLARERMLEHLLRHSGLGDPAT